MFTKYVNEPFTDFGVEENRRKMEEAIAQVKKELGQEYPLYIGDEEIMTEAKITSVNPSQTSQVVGYTAKADKKLAEQAMDEAVKAFETWKDVPAEERARYLVKAAALMRRRKFEFSAWLVMEIGKSWVEADADVAEAIDFMEYYARQMVELDKQLNLTDFPGEESWSRYIPLGVGAIIPPWNFPVAILIGMTTGAIVAGNTVVLKPASNTPVVAAKFVELLREISLPPGVVNLVPGGGGEIGDFLVDNPRTRFINFTGSKEVGLRIVERAAKAQPGQKWIKRVHAEMGGKDTLIIDNDCDLEEAARVTVASAYGFQGQKCSACSRVVVHKDVYDKFLELLVPMVEKIKPGDVTKGDYLGPVCDAKAHKSILNYIDIGKKEGRLLVGGNAGPEEGWFVEPTVIADIDPMATISQEEIFGPVLAVIKANDFEHALEIANNTEFGLTGGVFSNNRENLELARQKFHVGNLYFNRKITGALVGVQPFGGFNMSGTCAKAGGPDYLLLFTQLKIVVEKY